VSVCVVR